MTANVEPDEAAGPAGRRLFRVVFIAPSGARLQSPGEPPAAWQIEVALGAERADVFLRDMVDEVGDLPRHLGLEVQLVVPARDLDEAFERARGLANVYFAALATAARAWIRTPLPAIAYEITAGAEDRAFRQWHRDVPLPLGKTPVPQAAFGPIQQRLIALDDPAEGHQVRMAVQFYTAGVREIEPVLRFILFWPAAEALDLPLRRRLAQVTGDQRHWGLKAFAREHGEVPALVDDAYDLRNDLFHVRANRSAPQIVSEAGALGDRLEALLAAAICRCLDADEAEGALPAAPSSGHPVQVIVSATIKGDPAVWGRDSHPHVVPRFELERSTREGDALQGKLHVSFDVQNCEEMRDPALEVWGPLGPNVGTLELDSAKVVRATGGEESLTPKRE